MLSPETVTILKALEKLETGLSRIYNHLAEKGHFSGPAKKFWSTIRDEEILHAKAFREILEKGQAEQTFDLAIQFDMGTLHDFVEKVKALLDRVKKEDVTESEAYSLAALIEAELNEASFMEGIKTTDPMVNQKIKRIANDTKRHRVILVNYSRGIK
ncbi:MAG: hypothetical protein JXL84_03090 [Deltaproteobacteria bacterium]|nr:hypothetical protein [Deltaproteobacteria bacterium]